ncbi:MAG: hypothetical protein PXX83_09570, partial [Candidatus Nitrosotalea sp.]|nr:hypothetical protein [Candidatus Nitrosotalea sp.]
EWDDHVCSRQFKGIRNIEVLQWWETKGDHGERVAFGLGADGYTYKMTESKEGFIELKTDQPRSDGFTHREQPDGDSPEPFQRFCYLSVRRPLMEKTVGSRTTIRKDLSNSRTL